MGELSTAALEGVIVDDSPWREHLCQAMIEGTTEFDWEPGLPNSLPEHLRDGLRTWAEQFRAWSNMTERSHSRN